MKSKRILSITFVLMAASLLLSACSGGLAASSWPGVTVAGDVAYVAYGSEIGAVNLSTGNLTWRYPEKVDARTTYYAAPQLDGTQLLVGDYANKLHSLDANTGTAQWAFEGATGRYIAPVKILPDAILAANADHHLYVLDRQGQLRWKFETQQGVWAQPVTDENFIYLAGMDRQLYALPMAGGEPRWTKDLGGSVVYGLALDADGVLYVSTMAKEVIALRAENGQELWRFAAQGVIWARPVVKDGKVFVGDLTGKFYGIDAKNGQAVWSVDTGAPVIAAAGQTPENLVVVNEKGDVIFLTLDGSIVWTRTVNGKLYSSPAVGEKHIVVAALEGENLLVAFDFQGNQTWQFQFPKK